MGSLTAWHLDKEETFLEMERGSNLDPGASEEDALSTPPAPPSQSWCSADVYFFRALHMGIESVSVEGAVH